jgi:GNAT superfamily N-acetyltransferase
MCVDITVVNADNKQRVKEIYFNSFPKNERMPFWLMLVMSKLWNTQFLAFCDGETVCGFAYMAVTRKLIFVMFLAVDEGIRSYGYGSRILDELRLRFPARKMIVSIERCDTEAVDIETRIRRKQFYMRNAFVETGYFLKLSGVEQEILVSGGIFSKREFSRFFICYSNGTMYPQIWANESRIRIGDGEA